MSNDVDTAVCL